jgi:putative ABC transport system permease protein
MFARMLLRAAVLRRGRAASALLAMIVAAAVATAMMNLYVDVQAKLRTEFRNYGANIVIVGKDGQSLPADALAKVESTLGAKTLAVPFSYAVARTKDGQSVVVVGTDFTRARQLNHWWKVSHWPDAPNEALIGMRAATVVSPKASPNRQPFELTFQGKAIQLAPAGMLQTGAGEDSRIYLDQSEFQNWTGIAPSTIEVAANGTAAEVETSIRQLTQLLPTADIRPVRQIMEGEANVLNKTRATLYASATLVVLTSALCVLATLIGWV